MTGDINQIHLKRLSDIPSGWKELSVADVVEMVSTNKKKLAQRDYLQVGEYPVIDQGQEYVSGFSDDSSLLVDQDPPFIVFGDHTRVFKYVTCKFVPGADGVKVLKPGKSVDPKWCYFAFQAIRLPDKGYARHFQYLKEAYLPVPPLEQQKQIVAKIEELFSHIDAGIDALKQSKKLLKQYRQSVLKAAVTGELSKEWREQNKSKLEPASTLLERILHERRQKWEVQQLEQFKAKGKVPKDEGWKAKYKEPSAPDTSDLPELPEGWCWVGVEQFSDQIVDCLHSTAKFIDKGRFCIDTNCMAEGEIVFSEARFVSEETFQERIQRLKPEAGDIFFSREGTIGLTAVVPSGVELCLGQRMMMFRPASGFNSVFLMRAMLSPVFVSQWKKKVMGTTAPHINIGDVRKMHIPMPSFIEQKVISSIVQSMLDSIAALEKSIDYELQRSERLKQSVLQSAFGGLLSGGL